MQFSFLVVAATGARVVVTAVDVVVVVVELVVDVVVDVVVVVVVDVVVLVVDMVEVVLVVNVVEVLVKLVLNEVVVVVVVVGSLSFGIGLFGLAFHTFFHGFLSLPPAVLPFGTRRLFGTAFGTVLSLKLKFDCLCFQLFNV